MTVFSQFDHAMMDRALELAAKAAGQTRPNPLVGAVIVNGEGKVLGEGYHHRAGLPHAEVEALRAAEGQEVRGATIYVTLEPCNHRGRTGPCSEAIVRAGIRRVVIAMADPNPVARGGADSLRSAGISVAIGCRRQEAMLLNPGFVTSHMLGRPLVTLKWAMTLDGCTAVASGDSKWITSETAREEVHRHRATHDAVLAGIGTVQRDNARLTARVTSPPPGPALQRCVLDTHLRLAPDATFLQEAGSSPALVLCGLDANKEREQLLVDAGATVLRLATHEGHVSLPEVMRLLRERHIQSLYIEGGRTVAGAFVAANLVDRVQCWIAPKLSGGGPNHLGPVHLAPPLTFMNEAIELHTMKCALFPPDLLVEGWISGHLFE